ncbi:MAG: 23S rRNA (adenine(2030)-N(6))-methyltransferase RlmJ [Legionella sp.]|nr:MAG: 23S rRNA (adenine(2030)-N(6))-methyltransferase RlmJ [Legionella sp.]
MLSYQHGYHAGTFADVVKHLALTRVLAYLKQKDKPLFYLETHSGKGLYDLRDTQAVKTGESKQGIQLLWPQRNTLPPVFNDYLQSIISLNQSGELRHYPGSPWLAMHSLRNQDRMYFCELHPKEYQLLNQLPHLNKKVHISHSDGIASLKSLLPPPEKRGLIFIDPAYEIKEEYKKIPQAIKQSYQHFSQGVYGLWYPVVDKKFTEQLLRGMQDIGAKNTLHIQFNLTLARQDGMTGCGLCFINPPYTLAEEMKEALECLKRYFNPGVSSYRIETF